MAGYQVIASIKHIEGLQRRKFIASRIKSKLEEHRGLTRRSGHLYETAFVHLYNSQDLLVAGHTAEYASYLTLGTTRGIKEHRWIIQAIRRYLGSGKVIKQGKIP